MNIEKKIADILKEEFKIDTYVGSMPESAKPITLTVRDISSLRDAMYKVYSPVIQLTILEQNYARCKQLSVFIIDFLNDYKTADSEFIIDGITIINNVNFRKENYEYRIIDIQVNYREKSL